MSEGVRDYKKNHWRRGTELYSFKVIFFRFVFYLPSKSVSVKSILPAFIRDTFSGVFFPTSSKTNPIYWRQFVSSEL